MRYKQKGQTLTCSLWSLYSSYLQDSQELKKWGKMGDCHVSLHPGLFSDTLSWPPWCLSASQLARLPVFDGWCSAHLLLSLSLSVSFSLSLSLSISLYPWSIFSRPPSLHALSFSSNSTCFHLFFSSYSRHRDTHFHEPSLHRHYLPCDPALYCFHRYCTGEKIKGEIALTLKPAGWVQVCVAYVCVDVLPFPLISNQR